MLSGRVAVCPLDQVEFWNSPLLVHWLALKLSSRGKLAAAWVLTVSQQPAVTASAWYLPPLPGANLMLRTRNGDAPGCVGVDTGSRVVFAGQGLAWDPSGDRWSVIASGPFGDPYLEDKAQAWTGSRVMFWGGGTTRGPGDAPPATVKPGGAAYDPGGDRWEALPAAPLTPRAGAVAAWTGREFIVWGGEGDESHRAQFDDGAGYTP